MSIGVQTGVFKLGALINPAADGDCNCAGILHDHACQRSQLVDQGLSIVHGTHREKSYPAKHEAIIEPDLFDRVSRLLDGDRVDNKHAVGNKIIGAYVGRASTIALIAGCATMLLV